MSNRETFRDGPLLTELLDSLQTELRDHEELIALNKRRYAEKVRNAVRNEDGVKALEELLASDPSLAALFGTLSSGAVGADTATGKPGKTTTGKRQPFSGVEFPTYFHRVKDKSTSARVEIPLGGLARVSFSTDAINNYFTRRRPARGKLAFAGQLRPSFSLFDGRLTFICKCPADATLGSQRSFSATITDKRGSGPFELTCEAVIVQGIEPRRNKKRGKKRQPPNRMQGGPSKPDIEEQDLGPNNPPLKIEKVPETDRLKIIINVTCSLLDDARRLRPQSDEPAVDFVFKYGLALVAMGLLDKARQSSDWQVDDAKCREDIASTCVGVARVIVPLCLSLSENIPASSGSLR